MSAEPDYRDARPKGRDRRHTVRRETDREAIRLNLLANGVLAAAITWTECPRGERREALNKLFFATGAYKDAAKAPPRDAIDELVDQQAALDAEQDERIGWPAAPVFDDVAVGDRL